MAALHLSFGGDRSSVEADMSRSNSILLSGTSVSVSNIVEERAENA